MLGKRDKENSNMEHDFGLGVRVRFYVLYGLGLFPRA